MLKREGRLGLLQVDRFPTPDLSSQSSAPGKKGKLTEAVVRDDKEEEQVVVRKDKGKEASSSG